MGLTAQDDRCAFQTPRAALASSAGRRTCAATNIFGIFQKKIAVLSCLRPTIEY
jgi:hypothetical protein